MPAPVCQSSAPVAPGELRGRRRDPRFGALVLLCVIALASCGPPASARFEVGGALAYPECFALAFPFVPIFDAYRERADSVGLFFQSRGGNFQLVDVVHLEILDPKAIPVGAPIPMDPLVGRDSQVVADVELGESCPDLSDALTIAGDVTFDQFSQEIDGVIAGAIDGSLQSVRTGETVAETFTGEFEFTVQVGQPYEEFRN